MKAELALFVALLVLTACSGSPAIRYYALSAEPTAPNVPSKMARPPGAPYAIDMVTVPDLLDRPQIVLRTSTSAVEMLDYDRWAAPLPDQLERILAADLAARLGPEAIVDPGLPDSQAARRITVSVLEFDPRRGGESSLEASWVISDGKAGSPALNGRIFRTRRVTTASGTDVNALVETMSGLVAVIADDIATTLVASK